MPPTTWYASYSSPCSAGKAATAFAAARTAQKLARTNDASSAHQTFAKKDLPESHRIVKEGDVTTLDHNPDRYVPDSLIPHPWKEHREADDVLQPEYPRRRRRHRQEGHSRLIPHLRPLLPYGAARLPFTDNAFYYLSFHVFYHRRLDDDYGLRPRESNRHAHMPHSPAMNT